MSIACQAIIHLGISLLLPAPEFIRTDLISVCPKQAHQQRRRRARILCGLGFSSPYLYELPERDGSTECLNQSIIVFHQKLSNALEHFLKYCRLYLVRLCGE
jgi:hypothetical protein